MRKLFFILCFASICYGQAQIPDSVNLQAEQVRAAVKSVAANPKTRVKLTLRTLGKLEGTIIDAGDRSFEIKSKKERKRYYVAYHDVLELESKSVSMSFFPDPKQAPFGSWDMVRRLKLGDRVQIHLEKGKQAEGVFFESTDSELKILRGNKTLSFGRREISKVFYLRNKFAERNQSTFGGVHNADLISAVVILVAQATIMTVKKLRQDNRVLIFAK